MKKKEPEEKLNPVIALMTDQMNADLSTVSIDNNLSGRNEVIRIACRYLLENKKKFNLK